MHENTSDLSGQRFRTRLSGEEFFLSDHVVQGRRVLPGVAYLEMARAAVAKSVEEDAGGEVSVRLKDVVWVRPVVVDGAAVELEISLHPESDEEIVYEITSPRAGAEGAEDVLHCQGRAVLGAVEARPVLDIAGLRSGCSDEEVSSDECYARLNRLGLAYGPAQQGMSELHIGRDEAGRPQVLAGLALPSQVQETAAAYVLHPSVLDGALQASVGLEFGGAADSRVFLPFAVEQVRIFGASPARGFAWVRYSAGCAAGDAVRKLDIDVCDEQGLVSVQLCGFSTRAVEGLKPGGTLLLERAWRAQAVAEGSGFAAAQHWVVLCEPEAAAGERRRAGAADSDGAARGAVRHVKE